jgi:hypothetical protein
VIVARAENVAAMGGGLFRLPRGCTRIAMIPGLSVREEQGRMVLTANGIDVVVSQRGYAGPIPADSRYDARLRLREEKTP